MTKAPAADVEQAAIKRAFDAPRRTLYDLADVMGVTVSAAMKYRNGERKMPVQARLLLAAYLDRQADALREAAEALRDTVE